MKTFNAGDIVKITLTIEAEVNSEKDVITEEELVNMLYADNSYRLKSVCANEEHELLYLQSNIEIDSIN